MLSLPAVIRAELIDAAEPRASARGLTAPEAPPPRALGEGPGRFALQGSTARIPAGTGAPFGTRRQRGRPGEGPHSLPVLGHARGAPAPRQVPRWKR